MKKGLLFVFLVMACRGTDYIDDPIVGASIKVSKENIGLMEGEQETVTATYFNIYGIEEKVALEWLSNNTDVATVTDGIISAKTKGTAIITANFGTTPGPQIAVTVVKSESVVANVIIQAPSETKLRVGQQVQLTYKTTTARDIEVTEKTVKWFSENSNIVSVTTSGLVTAIGDGTADVHAKYPASNPNEVDVKSNIITFTVSGVKGMRTGTFVSAGGYHTSGSATLMQEGQNLILTLSNDFDTDFALGTFIYLANSPHGRDVRSSGKEIMQITKDGAHTFMIPDTDINDYRYVITLCRPASVTFGYADMK